MKNTKIKQLVFTTVTGLFLSACGGGSSSTDTGITPPVPEIKVPPCGTAADKGKSLAEDVSGKTIQKVETEAKVRIWHDPDGTKSACMITGEATII